MSPRITKPTKWHVRPAKTQISLGICSVWLESSLSTRRKLGSSATHWAHSEDSDQTGRMPRLIWIFAGRICHFVIFVMRWLNCYLYTHIKYSFMLQSYTVEPLTRASLGLWKFGIMEIWDYGNLGLWKFVLDMGSSSHWGLIMTPGRKWQQFKEFFSIFYTIMVCWVYSLDH